MPPLAGATVKAHDIPATATNSAILRETAAQSIANNTPVAVTFSIEDRDQAGGHSASGSTWTAPVDGLYIASVAGTVVANAAGRVELRLAVNGTAVTQTAQPNSTTSAPHQALATVLQLNAGDTVSMVLFQNSGGALNTSVSNGNPRLTIALLVEL